MSLRTDNLKLKIEELANTDPPPSPISAGDVPETLQIFPLVTTNKLEEGDAPIIPNLIYPIVNEEDDSAQLLNRPNNIPCKDFHKEIIQKPGHPNRINIYIYPPKQHTEILIEATGDNKIKNKRGLKLFLTQLKKKGIILPPECNIDFFGTFYTKATSLSGKDKELFEAFREKNDDAKSLESDEESIESEDDQMFRKLEQEFKKDEYIVKLHPEIIQINSEELLTLSNAVRDSDGRIIDDLHKTLPFLTKYERTRILGIRTKQLNCGAKPFIRIGKDMMDGYNIALMELKEGKIPFIIRRPLPNGASEYWKMEDLEILF